MDRLRVVKFLYKLRFFEYLYRSELVKWLYKRFFVSSFPQSQYYFELVNRCNAECIFCTYPILRDGGKQLVNMSDNHFDKIISIIKQDQRSSISLTPTTGEIFMNKNWHYYLQVILDLDFVDHVHFYTNGILLQERNLAQLFQLRHLEKLMMTFSTGGADQDTYKKMFGKDQFFQVKENINNLLQSLKQKNLQIPVSIDIKLPNGRQVTMSECQDVYNKYHYKFAFIKTRNRFDTFGGLIIDTDLKKMLPDKPAKRKLPCNYLQDIRFAANGDIWLCGCVISELPGHEELKVGNIDFCDDLSEVKKQQSQIRDNWLYQNEVPYTCRDCTWYSPDGR